MRGRSYARALWFVPLLAGALLIVGAVVLVPGPGTVADTTARPPEGSAARQSDEAAAAPPAAATRAARRFERAFSRLEIRAGVGAPAGGFHAQLPKRYGSPVRIRAGAARIAVTPLASRRPRAVIVGKDTVYTGAYPGIDVVQQPTAGALKEGLVIHRPSAQQDLRFRISGTAEPVLRRDGSVGFRRGGRTIGVHVPAPVAIDDAGRRLPNSSARFRLTGTVLTLSLAIPRTAAWPVVVDPTFDTGQAADSVIGVTDFTTTEPYMGRNNEGLALPIGIASGGSKLVIMDYYLQRLVGFNAPPATSGEPFDFTIGRQGTSANGFYYPHGVWTDDTKLGVADYWNHRVVLHNDFPTTSTENADIVLGQAVFNSRNENDGGVSASSLRNPLDIWSDGTRVAVADYGNHRVLLWNSWPTSSKQAADVVLGQGSFDAVGCNRFGTARADTLCNPRAVWSDGTSLFVADYGNHRVLRWNAWPTSGQPADAVLGQPDFSARSCNHGSLVSKARLCAPIELGGAGGKLFVADHSNHRALIWNTLPSGMGAAADVQIGSTAGTSATQLRAPRDITAIGSKLGISDGGNHRVLIYDAVPTVDGASADRVVGHDLFTQAGIKDSRGDSIFDPRGVDFDALGRLHVNSGNDGVIARFPSTLPATGALADFTIGSPSLSDAPVGGWDSRNHAAYGLRITPSGQLLEGSAYRAVWRDVLPASGPSPHQFSGVVGQTSLGSLNGAINRNGSPAADTTAYPHDSDFDGTHYVVSDYYNHRVLIWSGMPTGSGEAADLVLGQPDFTSNSPNNGGLSAASLQYPVGIRLHQGKLFVVDRGNHRVLVWNSVPTSINEPADIVLGQPDMSTATPSTTAGGLQSPYGIALDRGILAVADQANHRVLLWNSLPTMNGQPADRAIGQADLVSRVCVRSQSGLCNPYWIALRDGRLAINDGFFRLLVYQDVRPPAISGIEEAISGSRATISWTSDEEATSDLMWDTVSHAAASGYPSMVSSSTFTRTPRLTATGLSAGTTYYYRVQSTDVRGNVAVSDERSFTTANTTRLAAAPGFASDATISSANATLNYGGSTSMAVGAGGTDVHRSALRFDLTQIPTGATIQQATLSMVASDAGAGTAPAVEAYRLTRGFVEGIGDGTLQGSGVTWNSFDGVDPWTTAGGDHAAALQASAPGPATAGASMSLDVTGTVADWVGGAATNEGWLLRTAAEPASDLVRFHSAQSTNVTARPVLTVRWTGTDTTPPQIRNIERRLLSSTTLEISWDTDEAATTLLDYGTTLSYGMTYRSNTLTNRHTVVLTDLKPNTRYDFRVRARDAQGNESASSNQVARTSYQLHAAVDDTYLRADEPDRNAGLQHSLFAGNHAGGWLTARSLLRFDLSPIPADGTIRSARMDLSLAAQASTAQPVLSAHRVTSGFMEGTGNPAIGPVTHHVLTQSYNGVGALATPHEAHGALTSSGWLQLTAYNGDNVWSRRSYDGASFGGDARTLSGYYWSAGATIFQDGQDIWVAGVEGTTMRVYRMKGATGAVEASASISFPGTVQRYAPAITVASDGYLWAKAESSTGEVLVARSTGDRTIASWGAPTLVTTQATPAHAKLVPLGGGAMMLLSQDGSTISQYLWDGTAWSAPTPVATDVAAPATWLTDVSFSAIADGAGGVWLTYRSTTDDAVASRYAAGGWSAPEAIAVGGVSAVAITLDAGAQQPYVFWLDTAGTVSERHRSASAWTTARQLRSGLPAGAKQLSASAPSAEALAVNWTEPYGSGTIVHWRGFDVPAPADGATWNSRDGALAWATAGGDVDATPIASAPAPNVIQQPFSLDLTDQVMRWHAGTEPNHGIAVRKQSEDTASNDWKAFSSSEAINVPLRPRLTVDYDLASITFNEPNAGTRWPGSSQRDVTWQTLGSGITSIALAWSSDGGLTWNPIISGIADTGRYGWTTPATDGTYHLRIEARNVDGDVVTTTVSDAFIIDSTAPNPVTDLSAPTPASFVDLSWTQPGADMDGGTYRIYRSTASGILGTRIATVSTVQHTDAEALADGSYFYTVVPVDAAGNVQSVGNNQFEVVRDASAPNPVTDLTAPASTNTPVALSWSAVTDNGTAGMGTYRVYRSATAGVLGSLMSTTSSLSATDAPTFDGVYYYTIVPVDLAGNVRFAGNNQVAVNYDTTAPVNVDVSLNGGAAWTRSTAITATLTSSDAAEVQLSEDGTFAAATWQPVGATVPFTLGASQGSHVVYARYRDAAGNVSATVSDDINLDDVAPGLPSRVDDGTASDHDYVSSSSTLSANWPGASDATSGIERYEYCIATTVDANGCTGTLVHPWTSTGLTTSMSTSGLTLATGTTYITCVRTFDVAANQGSGATCSDGIRVMSISGASPATGAQGRTGLTVQVTGTGFAADATASFSGAGIMVTSVAWVAETRVDVTIDIDNAAATGTRDLTITNGEGSSSTATAIFTIEASQVSMSADGCGAATIAFGNVQMNTSNVTGTDCSVGFGSNNNTAMLRAYQTDGAGSAMSGVADYAPGTSDWAAGTNAFGGCLRAVAGGAATDATTWSTTGSCASVNADPWNAIPAAATKIAMTSVAGTTTASASLRFGWRTAALEPAGAYAAGITLEAIAPNL